MNRVIERRKGPQARRRRSLLHVRALGLVAAVALGAGLIVGGPAPQSATADVGTPSWWNGDCNATTWNATAATMGWTGAGAHRLGASYLGVPVCGPRPGADGAPNVAWSKPGWGELEWQCPELAFRFMAQFYGVSAYGANGGDVVRNYTSAAGGELVKIDNGTVGMPPLPGDVISFDNAAAAGHVGVVASSTVDEFGNGSITMLSQNDTADGWRTHRGHGLARPELRFVRPVRLAPRPARTRGARGPHAAIVGRVPSPHADTDPRLA